MVSQGETDLLTQSDSGQGRTAKQRSNHLFLPRSPIIGRDHELAAIQQLLLQEQVGLLTLTGAGGIGKTRLALHAAANLLDHFVDGVYFVSLDAIRDATLVIPEIAQTLGVREVSGLSLQENLQEALRDRQLLLILDNFEQVVKAAPGIGRLLAACHRLKLLVTSRAALHLYEEQEFPVPPLALPDVKHLAHFEFDVETATSLAQVAAVALFIQRARAVKPDFVLNAANAATIARICITLDGLPLAIEVAAAKVKLFSLPELLARLQQRLTVLTGGPQDLPARQRTLRAEIDWSYELLAAGEQTLFRRLAVFSAGFTLAAAQAVCNATGDLGFDALDGVAVLVDQNLVRMEEGPTGESRFRMLETIREYAQEVLTLSGEAEAIRCQHAHFFLALAEEADPKLRGPQQSIWLQRLEADYTNLRAVLAWSLAGTEQTEIGDPALGLRLAGALHWFWNIRSHFDEARTWCDRALALNDAMEQETTRARALQGAGVAAQMQSDFAYARIRLEESLALWRILQDRWGVAYTLAWLSWVASVPGDLVAARPLAEASLAIFRELEDSWGIAFALNALGSIFNKLGDYTGARIVIQEAVIRYRALRDIWGMADALAELSAQAFARGDYNAARAGHEEVQAVFAGDHLVDDKFFRAAASNGLGIIARMDGDNQAATAHFTQGLALARDAGVRWYVACACQGLGFIAHQRGDDAQAMAHFRAALELFWALGRTENLLSLIGCITVAAHQGQWERAATLCGVVEALWVNLDRPFSPLQQEDADRAMAGVRARRYEPSVAAAWAQGQAMSLEEAVAFALAPLPVAPSAPVETGKVVESAPELYFYALGAARIQRGEHLITASEWTYAKAREVLFYLLCHPARSREQIGLDFWPDASPTQLRNSLNVTLHHLRRALGRAEWIIFDKDRYAFNRTLPYQFDLELFESHITQARACQTHSPFTAIAHLEKAVGLNQGHFLEDITSGDWWAPWREQVQRQYLEALLTLGALLFDAGDYERAATAYQQAITRDSYMETAHYELIRCYARQGERGVALRHYQYLTNFMHDELGLPPAVEMTNLVERLQRGEAV